MSYRDVIDERPLTQQDADEAEREIIDRCRRSIAFLPPGPQRDAAVAQLRALFGDSAAKGLPNFRR
jgi:hypothetical protein